MKRGILILITFIVVLIPYSCEDSTFIVDCDKCYKSLSQDVNLELKITIDESNQYVPITLYRGKIENGEIILEDTTSLTSYYKSVVAGQYYSAVARYTHNGRVIYVVDGRELKIKLEKSACSEACYTIHGSVLDLRIK
ncbi:MAG: hypothetical protein HXX16_18495 [Bacteroidales bacterium]|nr:hypothetical protein [Bacteroidales bacterium]